MTPEERNRLIKVTKLVECAVDLVGGVDVALSMISAQDDDAWAGLCHLAKVAVGSQTTRDMVALVLETRVAL